MIRKATIVHITLLVIAGALALVVFLFNLFSDEPVATNDIRAISIGDATYDLLIADTLSLRQQGLSGRPSLGESEGMLFVFDNSAVQHFWMKDMLFSIDIIWINENRKIVGFVENASPESYPESFSSEVPVQYVLEVNVGEVQKNGITVGDSVTFVHH